MRSAMPALLLLSACAAGAPGGGHVWQDARSFQPLSTTAISITGPVAFADGTIAFAGTPVPVQSLGLRDGPWKDDGGTAIAEVFRLAADPGRLLNGNRLCAGPATYAVFYEDDAFGPTLAALVFEGRDPPAGADSPGLCGTFSYAID